MESALNPLHCTLNSYSTISHSKHLKNMSLVLSISSSEGNTEPLKRLPAVNLRFNVLPYGSGYFKGIRRLKGNDPNDMKSQEGDDNDEFPADKIVIPTNITVDTLDSFSLYDVLGLGEWAESVDSDTIKKAYHKAVLLYHPDKQQNVAACEEDARAVFLKIQEAQNTLSNEVKRRAYDSQLDFDDSIPTEAQAKEASAEGLDAFLSLFEPVFKRNARFASKKPVPKIGDAETSIDNVNRFYDYWVKFDSWRDFTNVAAEHDPDSATSREEKRWMVKENERGAKKLKKKEMARINELVMRAMEYDPRLLQEKERVRQEKQAAREAREREAEEAARREAEARAEEARKEEEERQRQKELKAEWEAKKKAAGKIRNVFRKLIRAVSETGAEGISEEDVEILCSKLEAADLSDLNDSIGGAAALKDSSLLKQDLSSVLGKLEETKKAMAAAAAEEEAARERRRKEEADRASAAELKKKGLDREWSRDDLSTLSKAIGKFPGGMRQRWVAVCNYMNDILKPETPFTKDECMKAAHNAMEHLAAMKESGGIAATRKPAPTVPGTSSEKTNGSTVKAKVPVTTAGQTKVSQKVATPSPVDSDPLVWTQDQQQQLEQGLKKYPASMDKVERWNSIAAEVTGKTRKDCISRYKQLREELQAKKS